ncbi:hypothetical protein [Butyrivibrio sp. JL13D10]|uniref:hypothetical protein n=1 Tax=Butyrivibrio sp. JL13D10 TaxID=3236815 RepID=UPI0038B61B75
MKKMNKKGVIATTVSVASMLLSAACGYGPPVEENFTNSNNGASVEQDDPKNNANTLDSMDYTDDTYPDPEPEDVYGPPVAD